MNNDKLNHEMIPTARLKVDPNYQRSAVSSYRRIVAMGWDPVLAGALSVADRNGRRNGEMYVFDGQQRLLAARELGIREVLCVVLDESTAAREALAFAEMNGPGRTSVTFVQRFHALLQGGDERAREIVAIAARCDVAITPVHGGGKQNKDPRLTRAVGALWTIYGDGGRQRLALLEKVLSTARRAWPDEPRALDGLILYGLAAFLYTYESHPRFSSRRLDDRLSVNPPERLIRRAKSISDSGFNTSGGSTGMKFNKAGPRLAVLELYNQHLRNPLPEATLVDFRKIATGHSPWSEDE